MRDAYEGIDMYEAARRAAEKIIRTQGTTPGSTSTTAPAQKTGGTPVTINLNGSSTKVNVVSDADAAALQKLLQQLANGASRTI